MNVATAKLSAIALMGLLLISVGALVLTSRSEVNGMEIRAKFDDAWPLVEGMSVRMSGAVAGSVRTIRLTKEGKARVTMDLHDGLPRPRADASVAIRQQDLLGDSYISLSPGHAAAPLAGPIAAARAIGLPRFDDFFDTFRPSVRDGLQAFLVELGIALEGRGVDLNETLLQLRPGFRAVDDLLGEVNGQNAALRQALTNAHLVTRQLAARSGDLDRAVVALHATLDGLAEDPRALNDAVARLPAALKATRSTMRGVRAMTAAARPLAQTFEEGAGNFRRAALLLPAFAPDAKQAARQIESTIDVTARALKRSDPGLRGLRHVDLNLVAPVGALFRTLRPVFSDLTDGLFGSNAGGGIGGVGIPANPVTEPGTDRARGYLAAVLVPTCELFGQPIRPGCLQDVLESMNPSTGGHVQPARTRRPSPAAAAPRPATPPPPPPAQLPAPSIRLPRPSDVVPQTTDNVKRLLDYLLRP